MALSIIQSVYVNERHNGKVWAKFETITLTFLTQIYIMGNKQWQTFIFGKANMNKWDVLKRALAVAEFTHWGTICIKLIIMSWTTQNLQPGTDIPPRQT